METREVVGGRLGVEAGTVMVVSMHSHLPLRQSSLLLLLLLPPPRSLFGFLAVRVQTLRQAGWGSGWGGLV